MGMAQLALDFLDASLGKTLLLAGGMVFGVFLSDRHARAPPRWPDDAGRSSVFNLSSSRAILPRLLP
jgi:hypothetical protein